jgi:hypothetical protein
MTENKKDGSFKIILFSGGHNPLLDNIVCPNPVRQEEEVTENNKGSSKNLFNL